MNDTTITVVGNVADAPRRTNTQNGPVTNFRVASTPRRYDAKQETFVDGITLWIDVECWNALSANVSASISKGDPVIVRGTLRTDSWETDTGRRYKPQLRAVAVGPDLAKGQAVFKRDRPDRASDPVDPSGTVEAAAAGPLHPQAEEGTVPDYPRAEELVRGEDYVGSSDALHSQDDPDLSQEPAHT